MAAKTDPSDQVKFLVCCIRNATSGKPDFNAVATELGIVSKAAAQKRYERMLKAHNVNGTNPPPSPAPGDETPKKTSAKKRGGAAAAAAADGHDETPTKKRARATKPKAPKAAKTAKKEENDDEKLKNDGDEAESSLSEAVTEEMPAEETEAEA